MKRIILSMACAMAVGTVLAQDSISTTKEKVEDSTDKYKVETNRFGGNWFISAGAGAQVYFGDHDRQAKLRNRLAPALDVAVGKWFTPGLGVRLMYSGLQMKGATQKGHLVHSTGKDVPGKGGSGYWLEQQKFNLSNVHLDLLLNLSNVFCGYNEKRVWNVTPYVGLGWAHAMEEPKVNDVTANIGLVNSFRLSSALDLNLDVHGMFVNDRFDGEMGGRAHEGMLGATIGLTYKFKPRTWNRSKTVTYYDNSAVNDLRRQLAEEKAANDRLRNELANSNGAGKNAAPKEVASSNLITFKIGQSSLSGEARVNLGMFAKAVKASDPNSVYVITGYADEGTGTRQRNERLSRERARVVYDCLINEFGVPAAQLQMEHKGGVKNMFYNDPRLSRAVITRTK